MGGGINEEWGGGGVLMKSGGGGINEEWRY